MNKNKDRGTDNSTLKYTNTSKVGIRTEGIQRYYEMDEPTKQPVNVKQKVINDNELSTVLHMDVFK